MLMYTAFQVSMYVPQNYLTINLTLPRPQASWGLVFWRHSERLVLSLGEKSLKANIGAFSVERNWTYADSESEREGMMTEVTALEVGRHNGKNIINSPQKSSLCPTYDNLHSLPKLIPILHVTPQISFVCFLNFIVIKLEYIYSSVSDFFSLSIILCNWPLLWHYCI